jgi:acyl-coenzyme A thioesterase PaaI-like protein
MKAITRMRWFLWLFGQMQVPMIGYLRPKLIALDDKKIVIKIPLNRRSKNHLNSMYFGALAVGADLAGGFHGFYHAKLAKLPVSLVFKSFQAQFLKRPEDDVFFISEMGDCVAALIQDAKRLQQRQNTAIKITAYTGYPDNLEAVAEFELELSLKV